MKTCKHCNINVGGDRKNCPFCQSPLTGEATESIWPKSYKLKQASVLWKAYVFVIVSACIACVFADFSFWENEHKHFSLLICFIGAFSIYTVWSYIKSHRSVPRMIIRGAILASIMLAHVGWYLGSLRFMFDRVIPWVLIGALIANFVFCFIDAGFTEDSIISIIVNILVGISPFFGMKIRGGSVPFLWKLTLLLSIISFIGIVIFKGRTVAIELRKRLNI